MCGTHGLQPAVVELVGGDVRPRTDNAIFGTGHEATSDAHLSGDLMWTLLDLRLQQNRLTQRTDEGIFFDDIGKSNRESNIVSCRTAEGL